MKKPWETNWKIIDEKKGGGQGYIYSVNNKVSGQIAILKKLKIQNDSERRRRMHREVTTLKTLEHQGIPDLIESNSNKYESDDTLYFIQEYVDGDTLGEAITNRTLSINEAISFLNNLLLIIKYAHDKGVRHRDIKPDNIILRNDDVNNPVLIDFGLTFNQEERSENITPDNQQLGNRFLALPELQISSSNKRDPRSDLTQCMGVLLYSITGIIPVNLFNEQEELPHQRKEVRQKLVNLIDRDSINNFLSLFDRAFKMKIDHRWQSAQEIIDYLNFMGENNSEDTTSELSLKEIDKRIRSNDYEERELINHIWHKTYPIIRKTTHEIINNLGEHYTQIGKGLGINWEELSFAEEQGIKNTLYDDFKFKIRFIGRITGNEIILTSKIDNKLEEVCRFPLNEDIDWAYIKKKIKAHYLKSFKSYSMEFSRQ